MDTMEKVVSVTRAAGDRQTDGCLAAPGREVPSDALRECDFPALRLAFQVSREPKESNAQGGGSDNFSPLKIKRREMVSID